MNEILLAYSVENYIDELQRIQCIQSLKFRKCLSPLKDSCYEDLELKKQYFETDRLVRPLDYDNCDDEMRIVMEHWYFKAT